MLRDEPLGDKLIAEEVDGLCEEWRVHADEVLADEAKRGAVAGHAGNGQR